jgi:hypothetical protein
VVRGERQRAKEIRHCEPKAQQSIIKHCGNMKPQVMDCFVAFGSSQ